MVVEFDDTFDADLSPLEYVILLGTQGNHVLFENERIKEAFTQRREDELADLGSELVIQVREAVARVFAIPDFESKKEYIQKLPKEVQDVLIYLYFQMIEKNVLLNQKLYH